MKLINIFFIFIVCIFSQHARACYYPASGYPQAATKLTINMGSVTTQTDADNAVIATVSGTMTSFGGAPAAFACGDKADKAGATNLSGSIGVSGNDGYTPSVTYPTNISGVGIRIYYYSNAAYQSEPTSPEQTAITMDFKLSCGYSCYYQNRNAEIKVELVKTGTVSAVTGGALTFTKSYFMVADNLLSDDHTPLDLADLAITATITANTCDVAASSPSRGDLEPMSASELKHKGATGGDTPFNIQLNCSGQTDVNILLDGQEDPDAIGEGVLAINDNSQSAKGVGLQLLYHEQSVSFEKQFSVGSSTKGLFTIPLVARYYRTSAMQVRGGDVSASLIYNLTYK